MSEQFSNAPLVRTIFEVRFPGEAAVDTAKPALQRALRGRLPHLLVPRVKPDVAVALQAFVFASEDLSEEFHVALNSFSYVTSKYPGYQAFRERVLEFARVFSEIVPDVQKLNRVGLRYVNHIPILRESKVAAIPLQDYLSVKLSLPASIPGADLTELNSAFTARLVSGSLKVMLKVEDGPNAAERERLVLDFDFAQLDGLRVDELPRYLDVAHEQTKMVFSRLIAESYFPIMRGIQ